MKHNIKLTLNGRKLEISVRSNMTLLQAIRDIFELTGTKHGCGNGECGACTVIMNGVPVRSCLVLAPEADGCSIITIEGISATGVLTRLQESFIKEGAVQCGFCTPGFLMAGEALSMRKNKITKTDIHEVLNGHLCRCTGYESIIRAFMRTFIPAKKDDRR
ncbi:(2Fe-2S)-binding protein [Elusimicrobiota bacterium]